MEQSATTVGRKERPKSANQKKRRHQSGIFQKCPGLRELTQELKQSNPKKAEEYEKMLEKSSTIVVTTHVRKCMDPERQTKVVMKGHGPQFNYKGQEHMRIAISKASKMPHLEAYANNIVKVREITPVQIGEEPYTRTYYISVEDDYGLDFSQYMKYRKKPLTEQELFSYMYQSVRGLALLNFLGIIHSDVKSNNLILVNYNRALKHRVIKVIDFDVSRTVLTTSATLDNKGTYKYMSLEKGVAMKKGTAYPYDFKSDAWSLGYVFLQMLLSGCGPEGKERMYIDELKEVSPSVPLNFETAFFESFYKKASRILSKARPDPMCAFQLQWLTMKGLLVVNPKERFDLFSALKFLKNLADGRFSRLEELQQFRQEELSRCEMRRKASREAIIEAEREWSYISQKTHLDVVRKRVFKDKEEVDHSREEMKAECYNCFAIMKIDVEKTRENQYWPCTQCGAQNCSEMQHRAHPNLICNFEKRCSVRQDFMLGTLKEIISCPYCYQLSEKKLDDTCQICQGRFCQDCSAKMPPIEVHGLHYHRKHCRLFIASTYTSEKMNPNCSECEKNKALCKPPKDRREWDVPVDEIDFQCL